MHHLEFVSPNDATVRRELAQHIQHAQHGNVGLAGTCWGTNQQILVALVRLFEHNRLDLIQGFRVAEC